MDYYRPLDNTQKTIDGTEFIRYLLKKFLAKKVLQQ